MSDFGVVTTPRSVRFERVLPGPIERVWEFLTDSEQRAKWLAGGEMELRVGGKVELKFRHSTLSHEPTPERWQSHENAVMNGRVTRCDPPRLLSFTWGGEAGKPSEVTFELTPRGRQVVLVLTHRRLPNRTEMADVSAGWHAHVSLLVDHLNDRPPRGFWTEHAKIEPEYQQRMGGDSVDVRVTRRFEASPERVFDAWLDPVLIGRWMFGPALRDEKILHLEVDARVGGSFSFLVKREGQEIDHVGTYLEIERPRSLAFTWGIAGQPGAESRVVVEIEPQDRGSELTLVHEMDAKWREYAGRTEAGWRQMLEVLQSALRSKNH